MPTESPKSAGKRLVQFTLRTLLLSVSSLAATLGAVRWLGAEVLPFILVAVGIWLTARTKARHLLVWLVPSLWSLCAFGSWHHRGDEYGEFGVCILPGIWLALLPLNFGHLSEVYQLLHCCHYRHWRRPSARTVGACGFHGSRRMPSAPQI